MQEGASALRFLAKLPGVFWHGATLPESLAGQSLWQIKVQFHATGNGQADKVGVGSPETEEARQQAPIAKRSL